MMKRQLNLYEKVMGYTIGWSEVAVDYIKDNYEEIGVCSAFPVTLIVGLLVCALVMNL